MNLINNKALEKPATWLALNNSKSPSVAKLNQTKYNSKHSLKRESKDLPIRSKKPKAKPLRSIIQESSDITSKTLTSEYLNYLESFVTVEDKRYLPNKSTMQSLVPFRGQLGTYIKTPKQFEMRLGALGPLGMHFYFCEHKISNDPLIQALGEREILNATKKIATIIFISTRDSKGFNTSGYIDFEQTLRLYKCGNYHEHSWYQIFAGRQRILPNKKDLSFINWKSGIVYYNDTDNFKNLTLPNIGLCFVHKGDKRIIKIEKRITREYPMCTFIESPKHGSAVIYDHRIRRKN